MFFKTLQTIYCGIVCNKDWCTQLVKYNDQLMFIQQLTTYLNIFYVGQILILKCTTNNITRKEPL